MATKSQFDGLLEDAAPLLAAQTFSGTKQVYIDAGGSETSCYASLGEIRTDYVNGPRRPVKQLFRRITVLRDTLHPCFRGLAAVDVRGKFRADGDDWSIDSIISETPTLIQFDCTQVAHAESTAIDRRRRRMP